MGVGPDMHVEQESLGILDQPVGVFQVGLALPYGLDFGPAQSYASLNLLHQKVVVARAPVMRGIALSAGHRIAGLLGFISRRFVGGNDHMTGLARHRKDSLIDNSL